MPQLIVRQIEERVVKKLKEQAGQHGVSMEEEHRRILRQALLGPPKKIRSFKEHLLSMPNVGDDKDFERGPQIERPIAVSGRRTRRPSDRSPAGAERCAHPSLE